MPALIAPRWRPVALVAALISLAVAVGLSVLSYHHGTTPFDNWAVRVTFHHIGPHGGLTLLKISNPLISFGVLFVVAAAAAVLRRWDLVVLAAVGPAVAVLVTEEVLKPIVARFMSLHDLTGGAVPDLYGVYVGAFPSGHETGVASAAAVVLIAAGQFRLHAAARLAVLDLLALWMLLAAIGLVRNLYHFATDTIGAVGVSLAVVLGTALLIDRWYAPIAQRMSRTADPAEPLS